MEERERPVNQNYACLNTPQGSPCFQGLTSEFLFKFKNVSPCGNNEQNCIEGNQDGSGVKALAAVLMT